MYSVVFAYDWNAELDEAGLGGRCLADGVAALEDAVCVARSWQALAWRLYGPGVVALLDAGHRSLLLLPCSRQESPAYRRPRAVPC